MCQRWCGLSCMSRDICWTFCCKMFGSQWKFQTKKWRIKHSAGFFLEVANDNNLPQKYKTYLINTQNHLLCQCYLTLVKNIVTLLSSASSSIFILSRMSSAPQVFLSCLKAMATHVLGPMLLAATDPLNHLYHTLLYRGLLNHSANCGSCGSLWLCSALSREMRINTDTW